MKCKVILIPLLTIALTNTVNGMALIRKKVKEKSINNKIASKESDDKQRSRSFDGILNKTEKPVLKRVFSNSKIKTGSTTIDIQKQQNAQDLINQLTTINKKKRSNDRKQLVTDFLIKLKKINVESIDWNYIYNNKTIATTLHFEKQDTDLQALQIQIDHLRPENADESSMSIFNTETQKSETMPREDALKQILTTTTTTQQTEHAQAQHRRYLCTAKHLLDKQYHNATIENLKTELEQLKKEKQQTNIAQQLSGIEVAINQIELQIQTYENIEKYILEKSYDTFTKLSSDQVKELLYSYYKTNQKLLSETDNLTEEEKKQHEIYKKWNAFFNESKEKAHSSIKATA